MAVDPQFAAIPVKGSVALGATADTSYTAPTHTVTILGAQGPRQVVDGVTSTTANTTGYPGGTLVTSATALFNSGDVGRPISGSGIPVGTIVESVASATNANLSQPATASASAVTLTLGGGIGTKIEEVVVIGNGSPTVAGVVNTFIMDPSSGSNVYSFHDSFIVTVVTPSTTTASFRLPRDYQNLWLPPGCLFVASSWVASQLCNVLATGLNC